MSEVTEPIGDETEPAVQQSTPQSSGIADPTAAYKGLQKTHDKTVQQLNELRMKYEALHAEYEGFKADKRLQEAELESAKKKVVESDTAFQQVLKEANEAKTVAARQRLILEKFPGLAKFEASGLLPSADPDKLEEVLTKFQEAVGDTISKQVSEVVKGAGVPATASKQPTQLSKEDLYDRLASLAGSKDPQDLAEYNRLKKLWVEVQ